MDHNFFPQFRLQQCVASDMPNARTDREPEDRDTETTLGTRWTPSFWSWFQEQIKQKCATTGAQTAAPNYWEVNGKWRAPQPAFNRMLSLGYGTRRKYTSDNVRNCRCHSISSNQFSSA